MYARHIDAIDLRIMTHVNGVVSIDITFIPNFMKTCFKRWHKGASMYVCVYI
jgi:hypothetical protein